MIKHGEINPLNVFNLRKFDNCAPHLEQVFFDAKTSDKKIIDWIYENLEGRFYLGDEYIESDDGNWHLQKCAAFEIKSEATYFCFMLDSINSSEYTLF